MLATGEGAVVSQGLESVPETVQLRLPHDNAVFLGVLDHPRWLATLQSSEGG